VNEIQYRLEPQLTADEFIDVLRRSTLAERRPVDDLPRIEQMLRQADIVLTARTSVGLLVGISRAITDFCYCCYLSDLAVDQAHQGRGIGKQLILRTQEAAGPQAKLTLLAAPAARSYYPHIGMKPHDSCWQLERKS
jgi:GNAT superfamily N-acetyltransferase